MCTTRITRSSMIRWLAMWRRITSSFCHRLRLCSPSPQGSCPRSTTSSSWALDLPDASSLIGSARSPTGRYGCRKEKKRGTESKRNFSSPIFDDEKNLLREIVIRGRYKYCVNSRDNRWLSAGTMALAGYKERRILWLLQYHNVAWIESIDLILKIHSL